MIAEIRSITKEFFWMIKVGDIETENPIADRYTQQIIVSIEKLKSTHGSTDGIIAICYPQTGLHTHGDLFIFQINEIHPVAVDNKERRASMQLDRCCTGHLQLGRSIQRSADVRNGVLITHAQR